MTPDRDHGQHPTHYASPAPLTPARRFVDPQRLVCPGCFGRVSPEPPGFWRVADGLPVPQFSHRGVPAPRRHGGPLD